MKKNISILLVYIYIACLSTLFFTSNHEKYIVFDSFTVSDGEVVGVWLEPNDILLKDGKEVTKASQENGIQLENLSIGNYKIIQKK